MFPDGKLPHGLVGTNIELALETYGSYSWTKDVPKDIFLEYIVSFVNVNEPRTSWRPLFVDALAPTVKLLLDSQGVDVNQVVHAVNTDIWKAFGESEIVFKEHQTPLIFDPMSTISYKHASCTGLSIFLVNALR